MQLNHHIQAKRATDAVLSKFKNGEWECCGQYGKDFYRTGCDADFPSPDAAFADDANNLVVSFEFKPPTETKRGILTGLGQSISYLQFSDLSYLVIPEEVEDYKIADHINEIFSAIIEDKIPVGLISYSNQSPEDVVMKHNILHLQTHAMTKSSVQNNRFWAKHVDMPIPLFHLLLHYTYLKKARNDNEDAFSACWKERMAPVANLVTLKPQPVRDVNDQVILTVAGTKPLTYFEKTVAKIKTLPYAAQAQEIQEMLDDAVTNATGENMHNSVRKNCLPFMHHVGMLDSACNLTGEGLKMYHLGMVNGPQSKIFRDYFARMVLLEGHHIDLIYDLERISTECRGVEKADGVKARMRAEYVEKGMIKTNPGRRVPAHANKESDFLKYEFILWRSLGLLRKASGKPEFAFDWQRITEVCNLPSL